MEITVRQLREDDLSMDSGFFQTLSNLSEVGEMDEAKAQRLFADITGQGSVVFVAVADDGQICGATTLLLEQKFTHSGGLCGHIEDVVTRKGYEGNGIGTAVMQAAMEHAEKQGCYKVILDCSPDLEGFYERFGFATQGIAMRHPPKH